MQLRTCLVDSLECSLLDSSVHGISQVRILEWVAFSFSRESSWPRDQAHIFCTSCISSQVLYHYTTWETSVIYTYIHIPFRILFHYGLSQGIEYSFLCYTVGHCCLSIPYIIANICQTMSLNSALHCYGFSALGIMIMIILVTNFYKAATTCHALPTTCQAFFRD